MDFQALFIETFHLDQKNVLKLSDTRFRITDTHEWQGQTKTVTVSEHEVWTAEQAKEHGYLKGGIDTSHPLYKIYRIF